jgi:hypothetical protein
MVILEEENMEYYQQGDVLFIPATIPEGAKKIEGNVVAYGEATGHSHRVVGRNVALFLVGAALYVRVLQEAAEARHEEHHTRVLPVREYAVRFVREHDHFAEEVRRVVD